MLRDFMPGSSRLETVQHLVQLPNQFDMIVPNNPRRVALIFEQSIMVSVSTQLGVSPGFESDHLGLMSWQLHGSLVTSAWYLASVVLTDILWIEVVLLPGPPPDVGV